MIVRVGTDLDTSAEAAWRAVQRPETLRYVTRGLLDFRLQGEVPEHWREGLVVRMRLLFFGVLPAWVHEIRIVRFDEQARELLTAERGGPVRNWNHRISIEPATQAGRCRYTDEIEIKAGPLTPLVWAYANIFYRYRQARWRRLARRLAEPANMGV